MPDIKSQSRAIRRAATHLQEAQSKANRIENADLTNLANAYSSDLRSAIARRLGSDTSVGEARDAVLSSLARTILPGSAIASQVISATGVVQNVRRSLIASQVGWTVGHVNRIQRHRHYADNVADDMSHTERRIQVILSEGVDSLGAFAAPAFVPALTAGSGRSWLTGGFSVLGAITGGMRIRRLPGIGLAGRAVDFLVGQGIPVDRWVARSNLRTGVKWLTRKNPFLGTAVSFGSSIVGNWRQGERDIGRLITRSLVDTGIASVLPLVGAVAGGIIGAKFGGPAGAKVGVYVGYWLGNMANESLKENTNIKSNTSDRIINFAENPDAVLGLERATGAMANGTNKWLQAAWGK